MGCACAPVGDDVDVVLLDEGARQACLRVVVLWYRDGLVFEAHRLLSQFKNNCFTELCSGSEAGSYLRQIDLAGSYLRLIDSSMKARVRPVFE